jgi:EmrB/QacA subfamily drug resistance transporter
MAVLTVAIGTFMSSLDSSIVNLVTPMIRKDFGISLSTVEWIVTAYLLVISSLLLTFGRISDLYGHKKMYRAGFVVFTAGSLLCGLSGSIVLLILCRVVQALGAGMLFSTGPAIITNAVPASSRGKAFGISAVSVAMGLCTGPVIGGALSAAFGWRSIFFINIPIGLLGIILVTAKIPEDETRTAVPFDKAGSLMVFTALILILLPLSISGDYSLPWLVAGTSIAAGILLAAAFVYYESKCAHPMLNLSLFRSRVFTAGNAAALFIFMAQFIVVFLAPFYLENLRMFSTIKTGMLYMPMPLATMLIAPFSGAVADRFDSRYVSSAGTLVMAAGLFMMSFCSKETSLVYIILSMILTGVGSGMFQTPNNSSIMGSVPQEHRGIASGTLATMRNIGMVMGVAISGALFSAGQSKAVARLASQKLSASVLQDTSFTYALHMTFTVAAGVALIATIASLVKGAAKMEARKAVDEMG